MVLGKAILGLALVFVTIGIYNMIKIVSYLGTKGVKVNWFLMRLKWFSYMLKYRELTVEETGEVGPYHRGYIISMLITLVLAITGAYLIKQ